MQQSGTIDVHMVSHDEAGRGLRLPALRTSLSVARRGLGWGLAVVLPVVATALGVGARGWLGLSTDVVVYFLATVVVALVGGLGPALVAAVFGGLLLNFFLTPPLYSLTIAEPENVVTVAAMILVAVLVALVVDRAARRAQQAARARAEGALLASFARTVLTRTDPLPRLLEKVREAFGLGSVALLERVTGDTWVCVTSSGPMGCATPDDADVDVAVEEDLHLVGSGRSLAAADRRLLEVVGGQALLALRSQRAAAEAEQSRRRAEATEIRSALLSAVGHDLRSPLTSIKAAAGSLRDPSLPLSPDDRLELTATIEESVDRLTALVDNLLDSSRLAAGAVTPLLAPVGYDEVAVRALAGLDGAARVKVDIDETLPDVLADAGLLERVVANVVDNALRYAGGAPIVLRASAYNDRVELRIVDAGPGVPKRRAGGAVRAVPTARRPRQATGTGLRRRARPLGRQGVHRDHGRHAHRGGHARRRPDRRDLAAAGRPMTAHRVLVVDDDPQILRALRINLTAHGYHVLLAPDGGAALRAAADGHPDVVVLDLGLPDMDGTEVIAGLRGWTSVPIIVLSARVGGAETVRALDAGADDYVTKPFGMAELLARLRAAVRRAAVATVDGEADRRRGRLHRRSRGEEGDARRRRGGAPHPDRVGHAGDARAPSRQARRAAGAAEGGVGARLRHGDQLPAGVRRPAAAQAGARAGQAAAPDHRAGDGLPLRTGVIASSGTARTSRPACGATRADHGASGRSPASSTCRAGRDRRRWR